MNLSLLAMVLNMHSPYGLKFQVQILLFKGVFTELYNALGFFPAFTLSAACAVALPLTIPIFF